ncbi:PH domain-containing protein [Streptomyces sp. NPDC058301]|uniref:PH domain-containing protein n=1 Tax=Streptomyces sp. NPDC058301 TaxID=3346436 RepID=UPI0036E48AD1
MTAGTAAGPVLRRPGNRLERRAVGYWTVRAAAAWLLLLGAQGLWSLFGPDGHGTLRQAAFAATAVAGAAHTLVMPSWRYRVHRWEAAPEALYTQTGWLVEERRIAPVSRIQTVDTARGPLEQLFGLTNVTVTTASAAGPLVIQGLGHTAAMELAASLTQRAQLAKDDAT